MHEFLEDLSNILNKYSVEMTPIVIDGVPMIRVDGKEDDGLGAITFFEKLSGNSMIFVDISK